jgi:uncharacterized protein
MDTATTLESLPSEFVKDADELRRLYGMPSELAQKKTLKRLDKHCRRFISLAPFVCLATSDAVGNLDVSPKGDAPGFVEVLNDTTLLIPDRMGNNRLDGLMNVLANPHVGVIFLIPGVEETVRINGRARIVRDAETLRRFNVNGKAPTSVLMVEIDEAFLHCSKALKRSQLWGQQNRVERKVLPTLGKMIADQIEDGPDAEEAERMVQHSLKTRLY